MTLALTTAPVLLLVGFCCALFSALYLVLTGIAERERQASDIDRVLQGVQADLENAKTAAGQRKKAKSDELIGDNEFLRRAVEVTTNLAERRGVLGSVERKLRSADIRLRPGEAIFLYLVIAVAGVLIGVLLYPTSRNVGLLFLIAAPLGPPVALNTTVKRRLKKFESQLPDMLLGLSSALRAGRSVGQGLESLSVELPDPIGRELRKLVAELRLGGRMTDVLSSTAERIGSKDFDWAVMAMKIQAEVGGNLSELLDQVADTMRQRTRFKGEVKSLTAEGRASAMMLVGMPPVLVAFIKATNPDYIEPLFSTTTGNYILGISVAMIVVGWFVMNKVIKVEV